jgi:hypothetical protein
MLPGSYTRLSAGPAPGCPIPAPPRPNHTVSHKRLGPTQARGGG